MKVKDLLKKYEDRLEELKKIAEDYKDSHYCAYMGEWGFSGGSEKEYLKLRHNIEDYLNSEVEL